MLVMYSERALNAHLACGLMEEIRVTAEQKQELTIISDLIEGLKSDFIDFCKKCGATGIKDLILKAKNNKKLDEEVSKWMQHIYLRKNRTIKSMIEDFNIKYNKSYAKHIELQKRLEAEKQALSEEETQKIEKKVQKIKKNIRQKDTQGNSKVRVEKK